jgi:hypothetical protein
MTLGNKKFGKSECMMDFIYSLLCVIKVKKNSKFITYPKGCFP